MSTLIINFIGCYCMHHVINVYGKYPFKIFYKGVVNVSLKIKILKQRSRK